ncbi:MAG: dockerin type I domain-containing protein [Bacteroidota bacterium]
MLNYKSFKFLPFLLLAVALLLASCGKENLVPLPTDDLLERQRNDPGSANGDLVPAAADRQTRASGFLVGFVQAFNGRFVPLPGVEVSVTGSDCSESATTVSGRPQNYRLPGLCAGSVCMAFATPADNGVDITDLVAIQNHISGARPFTQAFQFLAADANRDGNIDQDDLAIIIQISVGTLADFPVSQNIVFVAEPDYAILQREVDDTGTIGKTALSFVGATSPCLNSNLLDRRAIKTGDVNGDFVF